MTTSDGLDLTDKQIALGKLYDLVLMDKAEPILASKYFWGVALRHKKLPKHEYAIVAIPPFKSINICVIKFPVHPYAHRLLNIRTRRNIGISKAAELIDRYFAYLID